MNFLTESSNMVDRDFYKHNVQPMEEMLLQHDVAAYFKGELYLNVINERANNRLQALELPDLGEGPLSLTATEVGRLFFAPDGSLVDFGNVNEDDDGSPAGFTVISDSPFAQEENPIQVIAYRQNAGNALLLKNLHLRTVMLDQNAPDQFATVAFGLMAATAYRLGFTEITLFAAGRGPVQADDPDELVGYFVWPKFGFDAKLAPVDLQDSPRHLRGCQTVLDVISILPDWWAEHGSGREMVFDLRPNSRSWQILLNYLYQAYQEG